MSDTEATTHQPTAAASYRLNGGSEPKPLTKPQALQILRAASVFNIPAEERAQQISAKYEPPKGSKLIQIPRTQLAEILGVSSDTDFIRSPVALATNRISGGDVVININPSSSGNLEAVAQARFEDVKTMGEQAFGVTLRASQRAGLAAGGLGGVG